MKSLFDETTYQEVMKRLNSLTAKKHPQWGKMKAGQMMRHCQFPLETALGKKILKKPNFIMKLLMKSFKASMYNDKEWKKNMPTPKAFQVTDERDFEKEQKGLENLIIAFYATKNQKERTPHPGFGYFTYDQWGQMQYKHLDHHLRQFGV